MSKAIPIAIPAPSQSLLDTICRKAHTHCFACRPREAGGLGLHFEVMPDGSVGLEWTCPPEGQSFADTVHGGLLATALDSAMSHALFARGVAARTGELTLRYRQSVRPLIPCTVRATVKEWFPPLFVMCGEILQEGRLCVQAKAKFMATEK